MEDGREPKEVPTKAEQSPASSAPVPAKTEAPQGGKENKPKPSVHEIFGEGWWPSDARRQ